MAKLPSGAACARSVSPNQGWTWVLVGSVAAFTLTNVSFREPRLPIKGQLYSFTITRRFSTVKSHYRDLPTGW
jgi:hypothetical protein